LGKVVDIQHDWVVIYDVNLNSIGHYYLVDQSRGAAGGRTGPLPQRQPVLLANPIPRKSLLFEINVHDELAQPDLVAVPQQTRLVRGQALSVEIRAVGAVKVDDGDDVLAAP
jgi:hypothetical protein